MLKNIIDGADKAVGKELMKAMLDVVNGEEPQGIEITPTEDPGKISIGHYHD